MPLEVMASNERTRVGTMLPWMAPLAAIAGVAVVGVTLLGSAAPAILLMCTTLLFVQWLVGPWLIPRFVGAERIPHDGLRYVAPPGSAGDRVGSILTRRCRDAGVTRVRLWIVEDAAPNAFTFGRTSRCAHIAVTTGLVTRLDHDELDAVVCHELGHVRHRDAVLMTVIGVIPIVLYWLGRVCIESDDDGDDDEGGGVLVGIAMLLAYFAAQLVILRFGRMREYAADRWSCECTGNGMRSRRRCSRSIRRSR